MTPDGGHFAINQQFLIGTHTKFGQQVNTHFIS